MGGERRRRRLRRAGRAQPFEPAPDDSLDDIAGAVGGSVGGAGADAGSVGGAGADAGGAGGARGEPGPAEVDTASDTASDTAAGSPTGAGGAGIATGGGAEYRQRQRARAPKPGPQHRPSPADLAELAGSFALTAGVQDPEPVVDHHQHHDHRFEEPIGERGLRGLVGGGSSQVNVAAAMRARDASRPSDDHLAAAEADLPIVRRGWVPRDELPKPGPH
jgi:hypothetical protein